MATFRAFKAEYPKLKIFLSFGSVDTEEIIVMASSRDSRRQFAQSATSDLREWNFDGFDFYYRDELASSGAITRADFTALIKVNQFIFVQGMQPPEENRIFEVVQRNNRR